MIVEIDDLDARRLSVAENVQREDLTIFETIEGIVALVDADLSDDPEYVLMGHDSYVLMGDDPVDRVGALLGKLRSITNSRDRGSQVSREGELLLNKFVQQVEEVFKKLPKPLEWRSFYVHDLNLLVDICIEVRDVSIQYNLNKSQTRVLAKLNAVSESEFQGIVNPRPSANRGLSDFSATEIEAVANKEIQKQVLAEQGGSRLMPALSTAVKGMLKTYLIKIKTDTYRGPAFSPKTSRRSKRCDAYVVSELKDGSDTILDFGFCLPAIASLGLTQSVGGDCGFKKQCDLS